MFTSLSKFLDEKCQYGSQKEMFYSFFSRARNYSKCNVGPLNHFSAMNSYGILMKAIDPSQNNVFKCIKLIRRVIKETNYIAIPLLFKM